MPFKFDRLISLFMSQDAFSGLTLKGVLQSRVVATASGLYAARIVQYILPLITLPYLARVLTPDVWGIVVLIQAIGGYLALVVNYSFDLSATREIARNQDSPEKLAAVVANVFGARMAMASACVAVIAIAQVFSSTLNELGWLLWVGLAAPLVTAFRPFWFFLGIERVSGYVMISLSTKVVSVGLILLFVNSPADASTLFFIYLAVTIIGFMLNTIMMYRRVRFQLATIRGATKSLRDGWNLFVYQASTSVYMMSNTLILGFLAPTGIVAFYAGAERITGAIGSMFQPVMQAMYPRASRKADSDRAAAASAVRMTIYIMFALASVAAIVLFFLAPLIIRVALGPGYEGAIPVLRVLLLTLPISSIGGPLTMHWLLPIGREAVLTKIAILGGIIHIPLAIVLGSQFAHIGVAWAAVVTSAFIMIALMTVLIAQGIAPVGTSQRQPELESKPLHVGRD